MHTVVALGAASLDPNVFFNKTDINSGRTQDNVLQHKYFRIWEVCNSRVPHLRFWEFESYSLPLRILQNSLSWAGQIEHNNFAKV